jgi:TetR/AcrR family transcriptional repressor of mexJK operon
MALMTSSLTKAEHILEVARQAFLKQGYAATTTDEIQRNAGVSKATIYAHYPSKSLLFEAVIATECNRFSHDKIEMGNLDALPLEALLLTAGEHILTFLLSPTPLALCRIVIAESPHFPELGETFYRAGPQKSVQKLAMHLEKAAAASNISLKSPEVAASHFLSLLRGDWHLRHILGISTPTTPEQIQTTVASVVAFFLHGMKAAE